VCYFLGPLFTDWASIVMSVVVVLVLLLISFLVVGLGWGGGPVHLFFVVRYCCLFWIGCVNKVNI